MTDERVKPGDIVRSSINWGNVMLWHEPRVSFSGDAQRGQLTPKGCGLIVAVSDHLTVLVVAEGNVGWVNPCYLLRQ